MAKLELIREIISRASCRNQKDVVDHLKGKGFDTTQSSVSRELKKLGVVKVDGVYRLPTLAAKEKTAMGKLEFTAAGDSLVVVRTDPGAANRAAFMIDQASFQEIIGTIAGDDTIFIAVKNHQAQKAMMQNLMQLFGGHEWKAE